MNDERSSYDPRAATPEPGNPLEAPAPEGESQGPASPSEEDSDPYDELWDPNMDMKPERIRRTKARPPRPRGPIRGRRRDEA